MKSVSFCHKCRSKTDAKVGIVSGGYLVKCKCGNTGIGIKDGIGGALASWSSGTQKFDQEQREAKRLEIEAHAPSCDRVYQKDGYCDCGMVA